MAKKLSINVELPIRTEYEGLINIVALMRGWTPTVHNPANDLPQEIDDGNGTMIPNPDYSASPVIANPVSAIQHIQNFIQPEQRNILRSLVENALFDYYGKSQTAMISQALLDFDNAFSCVVTFETINP